MDMMSKYYCYVLLDPRKQGRFEYEHVNLCFLYEPFYVGKGSGNRIARHFRCEKTKGDNKLKWSKIKAIITKTGQEPPYEIIHHSNVEQDVLNIERHTVESIGRLNLKRGPLLNLQEGGGQPPKFNDFDEEKKDRIRQKFREKKQSPETRQKRASALRGRKRPKELCQKLSVMRMGKGNPMFGKKLTDEQRKERSQAMLNNSMSKVTYQYGLDGTLIAIWPSISEAGRQLGISNSSKICACCKGKKPQAYGFIWTNELRNPTS